MQNRPQADTDELIDRAGMGDDGARQELLIRHRDQLRAMVAVRIDHRLAARVDPSDVVQEALAEAAQRLDDYLRERPLPFYPWLRQFAWERLVKLHRHHVLAQKRTVTREENWPVPLPDDSVLQLARRLIAQGGSPSQAVIREELRQRLKEALEQLAPHDREILVMRNLEQLPVADIAAVLGLTEGAVKLRHLRALKRLRTLLEE